MIYVDYAEFVGIASDNGLSGAFQLSAQSVLLCLSLLAENNRTIKFFNDDNTELTQSQVDDIDGWIAGAIGELINEVTTMTTIPAIVSPYVGDIGDLPTGWLLCDGTTYLRTAYPTLYATINSAFIVDADHFTVPDLNDRFIRGAENDIGDTGGEQFVTLTTPNLPSHQHGIATNLGNVAITGSQGAPPQQVGRINGDVSGAYLTSIPQTDGTGSGTAHENRPPFMNLIYVISTGE